ncbi:MAG: hypothetical protein IJQ39_01505 [Thermoguttaceae bacterium]|nr:hypothetical protein [Thermoguttaceae bacterium]
MESHEKIFDVGIITGYEEASGYGESGIDVIKTEAGDYVLSMKTTATIIFGFVKITKVTQKSKNDPFEFGEPLECYDPRVIFMDLYPYRCMLHQKPVGIIPIPTMEEAIQWMTDADIPICDPTAYERWYNGELSGNASEKTKKFFNIRW